MVLICTREPNCHSWIKCKQLIINIHDVCHLCISLKKNNKLGTKKQQYIITSQKIYLVQKLQNKTQSFRAIHHQFEMQSRMFPFRIYILLQSIISSACVRYHTIMEIPLQTSYAENSIWVNDYIARSSYQKKQMKLLSQKIKVINWLTVKCLDMESILHVLGNSF